MIRLCRRGFVVHRLVAIRALSAVILFAGAPGFAQAEKIYFSDRMANTISVANLDGTDLEILVSTPGEEMRGIAIDFANEKIYWANNGANKIQRANLDGSDIEDLVTTETTALSFPAGIAVDPAGEKIYWADASLGRMMRANLDGSMVEQIVPNLSSPYFVTLDLAAEHVYWTDQSSRKIQRADFNGDNLVDLVTTGLLTPRGIDLDLSAEKIYWTDRGTDLIQKANLDGSQIETLVDLGTGAVHGIALDLYRDQMYWVDNGTRKLQRANLDGSDIEDIFSGSPALSRPWQIVLDVSTIPGDPTRDNIVDRRDIMALSAGLGISRGAQWEQGDTDRDGAVTLGDLAILRRAFQQSASPAEVAVPEPSSLLLCLIGAWIVSLRRRRDTAQKDCKFR